MSPDFHRSGVSLLITAHRRPYYLSPVIESWRRARGAPRLDHFTVALGRSDRHSAMLDVINGHRSPVTEIYPDRVPGAGLHHALFDAIDHAFSDLATDFLICGEEDVLVSSDVLDYFFWACREFRSDSAIRAVLAHNVGGQGWDYAEPFDSSDTPQWTVRPVPYFNAWGWGIWRDRWPEFRSAWQFGRYDWSLQEHLSATGGLAIVPDASRTQYIGLKEGVYSTPKTFSYSQSASFRSERPPGTYLLTRAEPPARPPGWEAPPFVWQAAMR